jgi:hypothetical protein
MEENCRGFILGIIKLFSGKRNTKNLNHDSKCSSQDSNENLQIQAWSRTAG